MENATRESTSWSLIEAVAIAFVLGLVLLATYAANEYLSNENIMRLAARGMIAGKSYSSIKPERPNIDEYVKIMPRKEIVVLGSSRMLPISGDSFHGHSFVNLAMSHASFEDSAVTYHLLYESRKLPDLIILTFEDWIFNKNNTLVQWRDWGDALVRAQERIGFSSRSLPCRNRTVLVCLDGFYEITEVLNPKGIQRILALFIEKGHFPTHEFLVTESEVTTVDTVGWQPDRSYQYGNRSVEQVSDNILKWKRSDAMKESYNQIYYAGFTELDELAFENVATLVKKIQGDNVKVVLFFPPMHPKAYEIQSSDPMGRLALESERRLKLLAKEMDIAVLGSNDPKDCDADPNGFVDAIHLRLKPMRECLERYRPFFDTMSGPAMDRVR
ncbi:MAG: hypothetical protein HQL44_04175 [Alphaproteobacteria bacterium]|nr:hypothetical protein [Alphaproteobacteria bacterium]